MIALWDAVRERPDDDGPREVLADALLAAGDPQGELIAVQLAIARGQAGEELRAREHELLAQVKACLGPLAASVKRLGVVRGLVEEVWLDGKDLDITELARVPRLAAVRVLNISGLRQPVAQLVEIVRRPLANLTFLHLARIGRGERIAAAAVSLPLERLTLAACGLGDDDAIAIAEGAPPRLVDLELSFNEIGPLGAEALAASARLAGLTRLDLTQCSLGADGGRRFAAVLALPALTDLDLSWCDLGPAGAIALAEAPGMSPVTALDVRGNAIGDRGFTALTRLARLETLFADHNRIGDAAVIALAQDPGAMPRLRRLSLGDNDLTSDGLDALERSPLWTQVDKLSL